jgi:ribosomal protein S18 acetylase RimI-like enzyme
VTSPITAVPMTDAEELRVRPLVTQHVRDRRLAAGVHPRLADRAVQRIVANAMDEEQSQPWTLRRDEQDAGWAWVHAREGRSYLADLAVSVDDAAEALAAVRSVLAAQGLEMLVFDVPAGDAVAAAAIAHTDAALQGTQMQLDLSAPVDAPARVALRAMTDDEFAAFFEQLVASYAQDLFDSGAFLDLASATESSARQTDELLPDGRDSLGHHLWTADDGGTAVAILWVFVDGPAAFIYDIEVRAEQRRRGYGREVLDAGARAAIDLGAEVLGLNVFGHNDGARALYESAGYATTEQTFRISLV